MGICLGGILWYRSASYEKLSQNYKKVRDDGIEHNLLLKEKNKTLIEKQNYEIYAATLKERNRIAREIHDHVGHMLSRAILLTGAMKTVFRDPSAKEPLSQLEDTLNTAMNNIRESVHDLHNEAVNLRETAENLGSFLPGRLLQKQRGHRSGPFHGPLDRPGPWRMGPGGKHGGAWECVYGGSAVFQPSGKVKL